MTHRAVLPFTVGLFGRTRRWVFVAVLGLVVLGPLARLAVLSFEDRGAAYRTALRTDGSSHVLVTTVALAVGSLVIAMTLGTGLAFVSTRLSRRLHWLAVVPVMPIVIPSVASVTGWVFLYSPRTGYGNQLLRALPGIDGDTGPVDVFSVTWIIVVTGVGLTSFVYVFARTGLEGMNHELVEAARVSGASERRSFFDVTLPLLRPALLFGGGIAFILGLGQFTPPLLLGSRDNVRVLTTEMFRWTSSVPVDFGVAAAIGSPLLVAGLLAVVVQRRLLGAQERYVTHSGRVVRADGRRSWLAGACVALYGLITVAMPLGALAVVALSPYYSGDVDLGELTLDNFSEVWNDPLTRGAIETSLRSSILGVALVLPVAYGVASVIHSGPERTAARVADFVANVPIGVPAAVFGAAMAFFYSRGPLVLYGTDWILVVAYVTIMLPFATRTLLTARIGLGDHYSAASRTSGAGPIRTQLQIVLPLMRGAISAAAGLTFVLMSHEFAASLLVRSRRTEVMGTRLYDLFEGSSYPEAAAMAAIMVVITAAGLGFMTMAGSSRRRVIS